MKTFLKILLVAALLILAIKFSPVLFILALAGLIAAAVLGTVGVALLLAVLAVALAFVLALSPVWIPVLVIVGIVSLFKRSSNGAGTPMPPPVAA